jgi:hypothetical protein
MAVSTAFETLKRFCAKLVRIAHCVACHPLFVPAIDHTSAQEDEEKSVGLASG